MGVRHRTKGSPPSTPNNSVYSGSRQSFEEGADNNNGLKRKTSRRKTPRSTPVLILTLFAVTTVSTCSLFFTLSAIRRHAMTRALQQEGSLNSFRGTATTKSDDIQNNGRHFPRIVFLEGPVYEASRNRTIDDEFLHSAETTTQPIPSEKTHLDNCVPLADWMTDSYPNCNHFHELSLPWSAQGNISSSVVDDDRLEKLGRGWFRTTWRWDRLDESIVLKTLRIEREFLSEYYDLHNRDAVAMERLTGSPYVVDVYGYCGQSAINELADFPMEDMTYLEKLSRRMRGMYDHESLYLRLGIASSIARGLADVHRASGDGRPMMAHYDINPRNVALFRGARAKINDFNIAEFLHYNPQTNKTCGFPSRMRAPWWRAPEEMDLEKVVLLDEKVDVYSLGSTLFHLFSSFAPRGKMTTAREETVREWVKNGKKPVLMPLLRNSNDTIAATFREVLNLCHELDPSKRATADEIATILEIALNREKK
eukprot:scaffold2003_cov157-Amphora_coffeaeformis.AAC.1